MLSFLIFAGALLEMDRKQQKAHEAQTWSQWDDYETMRNQMGVTMTVTPMPKKNYKKKVSPHKKHAPR